MTRLFLRRMATSGDSLNDYSNIVRCVRSTVNGVALVLTEGLIIRFMYSLKFQWNEWKAHGMKTQILPSDTPHTMRNTGRRLFISYYLDRPSGERPHTLYSLVRLVHILVSHHHFHHGLLLLVFWSTRTRFPSREGQRSKINFDHVLFCT